MNTNEQEMQKVQYVWARAWWTVGLLGLIALALGIFALVNPQATASLPIQLLGVFIALDGLFKMVTAVWQRGQNWSARLVGGAIETLIGITLFMLAAEIVQVAFTFILYLAGIGFLIAGSVSISQALQGRREWTGILTGVFMLGFGALLFAMTGPIAISLVWVTGIFLVGIGAVLLVVGFRMRRMGHQLGPIVKGDIVEGHVVEGEFVEHDVVDGEVKQIPDHFD